MSCKSKIVVIYAGSCRTPSLPWPRRVRSELPWPTTNTVRSANSCSASTSAQYATTRATLSARLSTPGRAYDGRAA
jgi:hypothetical protein